MGDKPDIQDFSNYCPYSPWIGDNVPDSISVELIGLEKGPNWYSGAGAPLNGILHLEFIECTIYSWNEDSWTVTAFFIGSNWYLTIDSPAGSVAFTSQGPVSGDLTGSNTTAPNHFQNGTCKILVDFSQTAGNVVASWDGAALFGVPDSVGYFAEEFNPTQYRRFIRYASHKDKTNVKIIGDY